MRKKILSINVYSLGSRAGSRLLVGLMFFIFLAGTIVSGSLATVQNVSAETVEEYCAKYTSSSDKNACRDGTKANFDCNDYFITFGQATADICRGAANAKKNGTINGVSSSPSPQPASGACQGFSGDLLEYCQTGQQSSSCNQSIAQVNLEYYNACAVGAGLDTLDRVPSSNNTPATGRCRGFTGDLLKACQGGQEYGECNQNVATVDLELYNACALGAGQKTYRSTPSPSSNPFSDAGNYFQLQDQLNQAGNLTELIDVLHANGQDADVNTGEIADNNYGSYINGAGKKQPIKVYPSECTAQGVPNAAGNAVQSSYDQAYQEGFKAAQQAAQYANNLDDLRGLLNDPDNQSGLFGSEQTDLDELFESNQNAQNGYEEGYLGGYQSIFGGGGGLLNSLGGLGGGSGLLGNLGGLGGGGSSNQGNTLSNFNFSGGGCPAVLFFNGGGWHANDHNSDKIWETGQLQQRGYAVFDVTYRLGSDGIYYIYEDVLRGIRHMINNSGMYGIDPSRIVIWGDSAGGHLVTRAGASGKSGAKAVVGWSAPTNAYTALFKSFESFAISIDHSTCIPTDLAGLANTTNLLAGGSGNVVKEGEGLASNDFSSIGLDLSAGGFNADSINPVGVIFEALTVMQAVSQTAQDLETVTQQIQNGDFQGLSSGVINLATHKLIECIDNLNSASPALFASPETPPTFLAGFYSDQLIDPQQAYDLRDKLQALGVRSEALILEGDENATEGGCTQGAAGNNDGFSFNHLGYDCRFICPTLNFLDEIIQPGATKYDCATGLPQLG